MKGDTRESVPNVLYRLAYVLGTVVTNWTVEIPEEFGTGYCSGFVFNENIRLLILNYELKEDLVIDNPEVNDSASMLLFKFQNVIPKTATPSTGRETPSVLIATSSINTDVVIPIHTNRAILNVEVDANYLKELVDLSGKSPVLQSLFDNTQPLLFEEQMFPSLQDIVDQLMTESVDAPFKLFFLRVKAEELICRLLMALERRDEKQLYSLNRQDIDIIYKVKEQMLDHLDMPPVINELAVTANMSPSKLKRLFRQIFGNSIFSYYQAFRMKEAARLLTAGTLTVSEVGNQLGFTNLSHFSRVFYDHIGTKPKQYSRLH
ncbi:helix-turn-helix domain-containing protein [Spirosoma utsteinense]|uniref:helix-turn-helix domain-containing protein n=1 Tax=Spirosoma utsteinense TaxID=2585773 RepID=UPI0016462A8F|nr:AraC family transcriptional regulator [Spirosoma utsteinense]MBC3787572.1 AraC-like DNA-binding protein [Spirosoma utsteinense]